MIITNNQTKRKKKKRFSKASSFLFFCLSLRLVASKRHCPSLLAVSFFITLSFSSPAATLAPQVYGVLASPDESETKNARWLF
jgi:hypothetical protein